MRTLTLLSTALSLCACATPFRPIQRDKLAYSTHDAAPGVEFGYRTEVLTETLNPKYQRLAKRQDFDIVAVSLVNRTDRPLSVKDGLEFVSDGRRVSPVPARRALREVRQKTGAYAWYLAMGLITYSESSGTCDMAGNCSSQIDVLIPIGLVPGVALFAVNASVSSAANRAFQGEVVENDLLEKILQSGERASGYLVFHEVTINQLTARATGARPAALPDSSNPYQP